MHHTTSHDFCNGMRGEIFGIFTSAVGVVIFNQVFEYGSVEIEFFVKNVFKAKSNKLVNNGTAKVISLVGNIFADVFEKGDFLTVLRQTLVRFVSRTMHLSNGWA